VFGGIDTAPGMRDHLRQAIPDLPDDPSPDQVDAWVELAELSQDPDFRASMRRVAEHYAAERVQADTTGPRRDAAAVVRDQVRPALAAGIDPASPQADPVVAAVMAHKKKPPVCGWRSLEVCLGSVPAQALSTASGVR